MKYIKLFLIAFICKSTLSFAQIPNSNFEEWNNTEPISWFTSNIENIGFPISKSLEGFAGNSAIKGEVIESVYGDTLVPAIISGEYGTGFPVANRYTNLNLFYKFNSVGGDVLVIGIYMFNMDQIIGGGLTIITQSTQDFLQADVSIDYINDLVPDQCLIQIVAGNNAEEISGNLNTYFIIDNLSFNGLTSVKDNNINTHNIFELNQNYPNPFNPNTNISFNLEKDEKVSLNVYNSLGENVATIMNGQLNAGYHNYQWEADKFPSGIYFYSLTSGNYSLTKKMLLIK